MDKLDKNIIEILKSDGRISNAEIARNLNVSEGTIRRRIKIMKSEDILNVYAVPNPKKTGYSAEALIGIQVDTTNWMKLAKQFQIMNIQLGYQEQQEGMIFLLG